jgi:hypothetical protein
MKKLFRKSAKLTLGGLLFFYLWHPFSLTAQSRFHFSVTTGFEITRGYMPGYDLTILYNNSWGMRYTIITDVEFSEGTAIEKFSDSVSAYNLRGDLQFPILLRTIDYRSFNKQSMIPFDFLTAYTGIGYQDIAATLTTRSYTINSNELTHTLIETNVNVPTTGLVFGFYGGEKFVVIDGKLIYFKGETEQKLPSGRRLSFDHWLIQISVGIGF